MLAGMIFKDGTFPLYTTPLIVSDMTLAVEVATYALNVIIYLPGASPL